jgi:hypothetical protein
MCELCLGKRGDGGDLWRWTDKVVVEPDLVGGLDKDGCATVGVRLRLLL